MDKIALDTNILIYNHGLDGNPNKVDLGKILQGKPRNLSAGYI
jgi:predicted nucleic acid-binding protein